MILKSLDNAVAQEIYEILYTGVHTLIINWLAKVNAAKSTNFGTIYTSPFRDTLFIALILFYRPEILYFQWMTQITYDITIKLT